MIVSAFFDHESFRKMYVAEVVERVQLAAHVIQKTVRAHLARRLEAKRTVAEKKAAESRRVAALRVERRNMELENSAALRGSVGTPYLQTHSRFAIIGPESCTAVSGGGRRSPLPVSGGMSGFGASSSLMTYNSKMMNENSSVFSVAANNSLVDTAGSSEASHFHSIVSSIRAPLAGGRPNTFALEIDAIIASSTDNDNKQSQQVMLC